MASTTAPEIFQQLAASLTRVSQGDFFCHVAESLAALLDIDHVMIARIEPRKKRALPLATWSCSGFVDAPSYDLKHTPCAQVSSDTCFHMPSQVAARFPHDPKLAVYDAEGYLGVPMSDASGQCQGIIAMMHSAPLELPDYATEVLRIVASLAGFELSRRQVGARADEQIASKQRALRLLNRVNEARFHATDEQGLLQAACRAMVEVGGYSAAWVHERPPSFAQCELGPVTASVDEESGDLAWLSPRQLLIEGGSRALALTALETQEAVVWAPSLAGEYSEQAFMLRELGVNAFVALPLIYRGQRQGVMCLYQAEDATITTRELRLLSELADDVAFGVDNLLHRRSEARIQHAVAQVATAVSAQHGQAFLTQLTDHMANALAAEVGFIATLDERDPNLANVLSLFVNGQPQAPFSYHLAGVPCQDVLIEQECVVLEGAGIRLPKEANGALEWVNAYVGRRLDDVEGRPVGIIGVMFKAPLEDAHIVCTVLQIFAARAASELGRQKDEARIRQLAFCDADTQLPNRADFIQHLEERVIRKTSSRFALLLLDLNHFKEINDTAGHDIGDLVLKKVAQRFRHALPAGEYLARLGGDEFVVVCDNANDKGRALITAERLCNSLENPIVIEQHSCELSVSVGISLYPVHGQTAQALLKHADIAMYQAKRHKLSARTFEHWMGRAVADQLRIAKRLAVALSNHSLYLHFQPQVDMRTGELIGAEALCRWRDDELGEVPPSQFVPIAEDRGMIVALGNCVIEQACQQLAAWQRQGCQLSGQLSINIAADQFEDSELVATLLNSCRQHSIAPDQLSVEITESGIMTHPEDAIATTEILKGHGLGLSIDDFGTGYSSLAYLKRFAADRIKIDISFIRDMLVSDSDRTIVATIIAMADTLGLQTIAEGIECQAQAKALLEMGCYQAQGYFYDAPLDPHQFAERWLK